LGFSGFLSQTVFCTFGDIERKKKDLSKIADLLLISSFLLFWFLLYLEAVYNGCSLLTD
jgi:hypothetical protein